MDITIGCDPELFVRDKTTGKAVSAYGLIEGTKEKPFAVKNGAYQVDGMALEFNTDPAKTFKQFDHNIVSVLRQLRAAVPDNLSFDVRGSVVFDDDVLAAMPEEALILGCDPDYNAYTGEANPRPVPPQPGLRTAAGHIHVGIPMTADWRGPIHFREMAELCKALDRFVGMASVLLDPDPVRRELYGCAGAMRVKPYGMEYRVPSNAWIKSRQSRMLMFDLVRQSMNWLTTNDIRHNVVDADVQLAINTSNVEECKSILQFMLKTDPLTEMLQELASNDDDGEGHLAVTMM